MSVEIEKTLNLDMGYPGIEIASEIRALEVSLISLKEFMPSIQNQYQLREKRKLDKEFEILDRNDYEEGIGCDLMQKEETIENIANVVFPRFFRVTLIGTIWAVYESAIYDLCDYLQKKEGTLLSLRDIYGKNHKDKVTKYLKGVIGMEVPIGDEVFRELEVVGKIRNLIAHRNGRIIETKLDKELLQYLNQQEGINIIDGAIVVNDIYIRNQFDKIKEALSLIDHAIADRYKWSYSI